MFKEKDDRGLSEIVIRNNALADVDKRIQYCVNLNTKITHKSIKL